MNILPMLVRLEEALGCSNLAKQMVLLSPKGSFASSSAVNLVVGYNGSPHSQTALDLTLWIAHQTRLATSRQVTVQVVYVINPTETCHQEAAPVRLLINGAAIGYTEPAFTPPPNERQRSRPSAIAELPHSGGAAVQVCQLEQFERADHILWQARNLAEEWRGSLKTHLRFGRVADELRSVVLAESASVLLLGCRSVDNAIVRQLGNDFPCPVLGIPPAV